MLENKMGKSKTMNNRMETGGTLNPKPSAGCRCLFGIGHGSRRYFWDFSLGDPPNKHGAPAYAPC